MPVRLPPSMQVFERGWVSSNNILFTGAETAPVDSGYATHAPQTLALVRHAELADWAVRALVRVNAARIDGTMLREPGLERSV
jgi:hypothetical protein